MAIDDLVNSALVGTARLSAAITPTTDALGMALSEIKASALEEQLLAAAIISSYSACGTIAPVHTQQAEPAMFSLSCWHSRTLRRSMNS